MIPAGTKVYFALQPADLRRSFDGLAATCMSVLGKDPREGGLFVFLNRRGTQVRVLFRDAHGWCLLAKRLDRGRFRRPTARADRMFEETEVAALMSLLDDIDWSSRVRRQPKTGPRLRVVEPPPGSSFPLQ